LRLNSTCDRIYNRPFALVALPPQGTEAAMGEFLRFEVMITPVLIQILFWIAVTATVIAGIVMIVSREGPLIAAGILVIILGPVVARIYAEILIVLFKINDHLRQIQHNTERP
jgi:hypothetical protein